MSNQWINDPYLAIAQLPTGLFLMTAAFGDERAGIICRSVVPCGIEPPLICVVVRAGHRIDPILRDSRCFAISRVEPTERLILHKFDPDHSDVHEPDPFDTIPYQTLCTGSPMLIQPKLVFDCEIVRHFDLESEFELFVGEIVATRVPSTIELA